MRLRPYQVEGVGFLASHPRAFLADDMGLGKSVQLISAASLARGQILVVAPAMVLDGGTWTDEIEKWSASPERFLTMPYTKLFRAGAKAPKSKDDKVLSYWRSPGQWEKLIRPEIPKELGAVVFDEAHYLKGRESLRGNIGQAIARRAEFVYLASGTPIPNYAPELFPLLQVLRPEHASPGGRYGSYWKWAARWFEIQPTRYSRYGEIGQLKGCAKKCEDRAPDDPCEHYLEFSATELDGVFLQRRRDDVLSDLPPLTQIQVEVPMGPKQRAAYKSMKADLVAEATDGSEVVAWSQSAKHILLDRISTGLGILDGTATANADNAKLARLAEDLQDRSRPTLVMAHYQPTVEACLRVALDLGLRAELVYGPTSKADRLATIRRFQAGQLDVLVGSLETLAEGLTLVAADAVIFVEKSWKPSRNEQALRRIHRLGQTRPVTAIDYVTPKTIDEGKRELLKFKTDHQMRVLTAAQMVRIADGLAGVHP